SGPLGFDIAGPAGFDIAPDGTALAALRRAGESNPSLYRLDLASGAATAVGPLAPQASSRSASPSPITSIAILGAAPSDTRRPEVTAAITSPQGVKRLASRPVSVRVACDEACSIAVSARVGGADAGSASGQILATAGKATVALALDDAGRAALREGARRVRLAVTATDSAGNASTVTRSLRVSR
ncbi:MAG TPA: DUF4394 domain-containing protein, partial [Capillimicrobium sp.]